MDPTSRTPNAAAAAAAAMTPAHAARSQFERKRASAAHPVAKRTAAAAAQGLASSAADQKAAAVDPKALALKLVPTISQLFHAYDKTLPKNAEQCLLFQDLIMIAQVLCILLPANANRELALRTFSHWCLNTWEGFSQLSTQSLEGEKLINSNTLAFWKGCQFPTALALPMNFTWRGVRYIQEYPNFSFLFPSIDPPQSVSLDTRLAMRQMLLNLTNDMCRFLEVFWKQADQEIAHALEHFGRVSNKLPSVKREADAKGKKGKIVQFEGAAATYDIVTRLLPTLRFYTLRKLPEIKAECLRLDLADQDVHGTIRSLSNSVSTSASIIMKTTAKLLEALGEYEAWSCYSNGIIPKSAFALSMQRKFYDIFIKLRFKLQIGICDAISSFIKTVVEDKSDAALEYLKPFLPEQFFVFLNQVHQAILGKSKPREVERDKRRMGKGLPEILDAILVNLTKAKEEAYDGFFKFVKSKKQAEGCVRMLVDDIEDYYHQKFHESINTFKGERFIQFLAMWNDNFRTTINSIYEKAKPDAAFQEFRSEFLVGVAKKREQEEWTSKDIDDTAVENTDKAIQIVMSVDSSARILSFPIVVLYHEQYKVGKMVERAQAVKADACLALLLLEENATAAKRIEIAAELEQKQQPLLQSVAAGVVPSPEPALPPKSAIEAPKPVVLPTCFSFPVLQSLFEMRCAVVEFYKMNPAGIPAPSHFAGKKLSRSEFAKYQHVYAYDGFLMAMEMYFRSQDREEMALLSGVVLQRGHLLLEQCMTVEHAVRFPKAFLSHELEQLIGNLGINQGANIWIKEASGYSVYDRYPHNHTGMPAVQLLSDMPRWLTGMTEMQSAALAHLDPNNTQLKKMQTAAGKIVEALATQNRVEVDQKMVGALSSEHTKALQKCEAGLKAHIESWSKSEGGKVGSKALLNARRHFTRLQGVMRLIQKFPQQRFLHSHAQMLIYFMKNFAENFGIYLTSLDGGEESYTHVLEDLPLKDKLKGKGGLLEMLRQIDIGKGDDYIYDYFGFNGDKSSKIMHTLDDFRDYSLEAVLGGESMMLQGKKRKDLAALHGELVAMAEEFTALACALVKP